MRIKENMKIKFFTRVYIFLTIGFLLSIITVVFLSYKNNSVIGNDKIYLIGLIIMIVLISTALICNKTDEKDIRKSKTILLSIFYVFFNICVGGLIFSCRETTKLNEIIKIILSFLIISPLSALLFKKLKSKSNIKEEKKMQEDEVIVYNYNLKPEKLKIDGELISEILLSWIIFLIIFLFICIFFISADTSGEEMVNILGNILSYVYMILCGYIWATIKIEKYNLFYCLLQAVEVFTIGSITLIFKF